MPFEAAKAVAATFCYRIRYVLTPIFGPDFPSRCILPGTPGFDSMQVAPSIIRDCADAARDYRDFSRESSVTSNPRSPLMTPVTRWTPANLRPKTLKTLEPEAGGRTALGCKKPCFLSSERSKKGGFQMLCTPRSIDSHRYQNADLPELPMFSPYRESSVSSQETSKQKRSRSKRLEYQEEDSSSSSEFSLGSPVPLKRRKTSTAPAMTEESAASRLLELYLADSTLKERASRTGIPRRASS